MLTNNEKMFITEHYAKWKPANFRYWEALPNPEFGNTNSETMAEEAANKPAIVMVHGYGASVEHFRRTFQGLKGRYRLYGLDLVGFGLSEKKSGNEVDYSPELWARQVNALLTFKGEERAIVVGHSIGGMVALRFSQLFPEKTVALALIDSAGLPDQGRAEQEAARKQGRANIDFGNFIYNAIKTPFVGETLALLLVNPLPVRRSLENAYWNKQKITPQLVEQFAGPLRTQGARDLYLAITRHFADYQLPLKPGDVSVPTLILWGQYDASMPPATMLPRWQKIIPEAETFVVQDAGHCPQDERPDLVNPRLIQFIEKVTTPQEVFTTPTS